METCSIQYSKRMSRGRNIPGGEQLQNQNYLVSGSLNGSKGMAMDTNIAVIVVIIMLK